MLSFGVTNSLTFEGHGDPQYFQKYTIYSTGGTKFIDHILYIYGFKVFI